MRPATNPNEDHLLLSLLRGTIVDAHSKAAEEAIDWWSEREQQLITEQRQRRHSLQVASYLPSYEHLHHRLAYTPSAASLLIPPPLSLHARRGALLNRLRVAEEERRRLRTAQIISQRALRKAIEGQRLERAKTESDAQRSDASSEFVASSSSTPNARRRDPIPTDAIEQQCRRFVLSVVSSAVANAEILARQNRVIRDLKWAIAKAQRLKDLTANGSIDRPLSARPKWITSVSQPTKMPPLHTNDDGLLVHFLAGSTEAELRSPRSIRQRQQPTSHGSSTLPPDAAADDPSLPSPLPPLTDPPVVDEWGTFVHSLNAPQRTSRHPGPASSSRPHSAATNRRQAPPSSYADRDRDDDASAWIAARSRELAQRARALRPTSAASVRR